MRVKPIYKRLAFVLMPALIFAIFELTYRRSPYKVPDKHSPGVPSSAQTDPVLAQPADTQSKHVLPSAGKRSREVLINESFRILFGALVDSKEDWSRSEFGSQQLPPACRAPGFMRLVDQLKELLGEDAGEVLGAMYDQAHSERYQNICLALLGAVRDPSSQDKLIQLAKNADLSENTRGLAILGLGHLNTESAWVVARDIWNEALSADSRELLRQLGFGFGLFGPKSFQTLLELEESGRMVGALAMVTDAALLPKLHELSLSHEKPGVRSSALRGLLRQANTDVLQEAFSALRVPSHPWSSRVMLPHLSEFITTGGLSDNGRETLKQSVLSQFEELPLQLQLSMYLDDSLRAQLPKAFLHSVIIPDKMSSRAARLYLAAMFSDPEHREVLLERTSHMWWDKIPEESQNKHASMYAAVAALESKPAAAPLALMTAYRGCNNETDRIKFAYAISQSPHLEFSRGAFSSSLLDLLNTEASPRVRMELAGAYFQSVPNKSNPDSLADFRMAFQRDYSQLLETPDRHVGLAYILEHPQGADKAMMRYRYVMTNLIMTFGSPSDIPRLKQLAEGKWLRSYVTENDQKASHALISALRAATLEGIDAIKSRSGSW